MVQTLKQLAEGESGIIVKVKGRGAFRNRITEMGFVKGEKVKVISAAPLQDPMKYELKGYNISLRRNEADMIEVMPESEYADFIEEQKNNDQVNHGITCFGVVEHGGQKTGNGNGLNTIEIAFVGNPNSGKTSLFNFASNSKERVANYGGVTVESKTAKLKYKNYTFNITDLPGTYSLSAYSPEEIAVREYIFQKMPDIVVNIIDTANINRNLYLTTQLIDMDIKVVGALNMYDEFEAKGDTLDYGTLGQMLGIPLLPTVASKGKGIEQLLDKIIDVFEGKDSTVRHIHINYGEDIEKAIAAIQAEINDKDFINIYSTRLVAIKLLEKDDDFIRLVSTMPNGKNILQAAFVCGKELEVIYKEDCETFIADVRYGFIAGALKETYRESVDQPAEEDTTSKLDKVLTNKYLGFPIFLFMLWVMFYTTFTIGGYPQNWIESGFSMAGDFVATSMSDGLIKNFLIDGLIGGVGGVLTFLPNIIILFMFISFMEDTGYMARVAFIMDKLMHKLGLHGRSFIPMLMGFGCNVPAIMATRTIENKNDRIRTILLIPFMSCSARLPVYILITGVLFSGALATFVLIGIYLFGILLSILFALIFKKTILKAEEVPFVMELPPYRMPTLKSVLLHMWRRASQYVQKMGTIILIASVVIWALNAFPAESDMSRKYDKRIEALNTALEAMPEIEAQAIQDSIAAIEVQKTKELQSNSYIGQIGGIIEPVMAPLGFDWKMSVSLLTAIAAKEAVISTLGILYAVDVEDDETSHLSTAISNAAYETGRHKGERVFSLPVGLAFLAFFLIYFPCAAVFAAIKNETGGWKWPAIVAVYTVGTAWVVAFLIKITGELMTNL